VNPVPLIVAAASSEEKAIAIAPMIHAALNRRHSLCCIVESSCPCPVFIGPPDHVESPDIATPMPSEIPARYEL
jgi:hypothetical protein